ncbi:MAG: hypothetical protein KJN67_01835, partial [Pontiella sp.]|nr:hypothetical protein [Pontiella sp.]
IMHAGISDILLSLGVDKHEPEPNHDRVVETMKGCVEKLKQQQRELLRSRYEEGRRAKELASEQASTAAAIRKQLQRIRMTVRKCMETQLKRVEI